jgi:hypothetical protein
LEVVAWQAGNVQAAMERKRISRNVDVFIVIREPYVSLWDMEEKEYPT